jgi:hypothetical protein
MAVDGTYKLEITTPMGKQPCALTMKTEGDALSGSTNSRVGGNAIFSGGKADGDNFQFMVVENGPAGKMKMTYKGSVSGDDILGAVTTPFGPANFKGKRME